MGGCYSRQHTPNFAYGAFKTKARPGETGILRHPDFLNDLQGPEDPNIQTLGQNIQLSFERYANQKCLGTNVDGQYRWKTYAEVRELATTFGSGVHQLGLYTPSNDGIREYRFIGIYAKNRAEWMIADIASMLYNFTTVTFYDSLGVESISYILEQTELITIILSSENLEKILNEKREGRTFQLRYLVLMDKVTEDMRVQCQDVGLTLYDMQDIQCEGQNNRLPYVEATSESCYTLCYTSGTTGTPKGVIMTHKMVLSNVAASKHALVFPGHTQVHLSYLPLPHSYERLIINFLLSIGTAIGFFSGDIMKLRDDLAALKPTILPVVPRLLTRFYDLINQQFNQLTGLKARLVRAGIASKLENLRYGQFTDGFYDALVFKKTRAVLGGRVHTIVTGSAPIKADVLEFLKVVFCCNIQEGYGQTETMAAATCTRTEDPTCGHVGGPFASIEIKLVDIPEMKYMSTDVDENMLPAPRGEICFRGNSVFPGYYKLPEITAEAIDEEGWLHSGDVGVIRPNGSLQIIDRKKNIFKLAQGEYIAPEKIENLYQVSQFVAMNFVHGDSLQPYLIAIIFPDEVVVRKWAEEQGISGSFAEICRTVELERAILADITRIGAEGGLLSYEQVKKIHITSDPFTVENGILTPTFKLKRFDAKNYYKDMIDRLYASQ